MKLIILLLAVLLSSFQTTQNKATILSDETTFYLVDGEGKRIPDFEIMMPKEEKEFSLMLTIKRKGN